MCFMAEQLLVPSHPLWEIFFNAAVDYMFSVLLLYVMQCFVYEVQVWRSRTLATNLYIMKLK